MIKEALQYVIGLGNTKVLEVNGQEYASGDLRLIEEPTPKPLVVRNLTGVVEYLTQDFDKQSHVLVHVVSPTQVSVMSPYNRNFNRNTLIVAQALLPDISFGRFLDAENFNILLQSCFVDNPDRATILKVVGNIKEEQVQTVGDTGITQQVVAKTGVATVENVVVPNPVGLRPFRTFVEIEQPESAFVFRMKSGPTAALFEADGGAWKLTALARIKTYLQAQLTDLVEQGNVTIIG